jgi:ubiquinone/menaquinone biosynthesis C-methylase UbiE
MNLFNANVRGVLDGHVRGPYRLDDAGARLVVESNEHLSQGYFEHLEFPVSDFWFDYFSSKIALVPPPRYGDVLDVCCGTGTLCLNIMRRQLFESCIAIDNSAVAIDRLNARIAALGLANVVARKDNVMSVSFADESFDAVVGNSFLHHLPDNYAFLTEMRRVLRPAGTICFTGEPTVASNVIENAIMGSLLEVLRTLRIKRRPPAVPTEITDIWVYEEAKTREMLASSGYTDIRITPFGTLVPLFNGPTAYLRSLLGRRSMQPDGYWKYLGAIDRHAFGWLPANARCHFVVSARKPRQAG